MMLNRYKLLALITLLMLASKTFASYPDKPIRLIVAFPAGGATDVVARALGVRLSQLTKQPVVVENKPGAGGNIGADFVAKSPPDGYTLLVASPAEVAINEYLYPKMSYKPATELQPIAKLAATPLVLVVNSKSPSESLSALLQEIRQRPGGANFASSGSGGPQHLAGELLRLRSGVAISHIPYKGGAPAMTDLLGGQVDLFFAGLTPAMPHIQSGKLRALGVSSARRTPLLPQVPTIAEQGFPGFDIENWQGIFAPANTPQAIIDLLSKLIAEISADKSYIEQLNAQGVSPSYMGPKDFGRFLTSERQKYARLIKESGAKAD